MKNEETFTKDMLPDQIFPLQIDDPDLDYVMANELALKKAKEVGSDPMLLSCYEKKTGRYFPDIDGCGHGKPAWITYAESRGANITVDINDGAYIFIYYNFTK